MSDAYVFGYGSLLCRESREATLREPTAILPAVLKGYRREWNFREDEDDERAMALGIRKDATSCCNGVLFPVTAAQLHRLRLREDGYEELHLPLSRFELLIAAARIPKSVSYIITFGNEAETPPAKDFPIVQTYVDLCLHGALEIEQEWAEAAGFASDFIQQTHAWSEHWIDERHQPFHPLALNVDQPAVDALLKEHLAEYTPEG